MRMVASPMREHKLREGRAAPAAARRATTVSSAEVAEEICISNIIGSQCHSYNRAVASDLYLYTRAVSTAREGPGPTAAIAYDRTRCAPATRTARRGTDCLAGGGQRVGRRRRRLAAKGLHNWACTRPAHTSQRCGAQSGDMRSGASILLVLSTVPTLRCYQAASVAWRRR